MKTNKLSHFCLTLLLATSSLSAKVDLKQVDDFIQATAAEKDLDPKWVRDIISQAEHKQVIIDKMNKPAEKVLKWFEYRQIFMKDDRIQLGVDFWKEHQAVLDKVSAETGVPAEIIVGIIGVETKYGRIMGNDRVLDALYTLAFDYPKRSKLFTRELKEFLLLSNESHIDALSAKGSYAGAMGFGQFIPSSYRAYAVDYDADDKIDLLNNPQDAIASVANYLKVHKWQKGGEVLRSIEKPSKAMKFNELKPHITDKNSQNKYTVLELDMEDGSQSYWQGFQNFYTITRYNHSHMYASAVFQLSQAVKKLKQELEGEQVAQTEASP